MSGSVKNITNGVNMMIATMQRMQTKTSKEMRVDKSLIATKQQIVTAESEINKAIEEATKSQNKFNNSVGNGSKRSKALLSTIKAVSDKYFSISNVKNLLYSTVGKGMEQQSMIDAISIRTGNKTQGLDIFDKVSKQALKYGQDVKASLLGTQLFMSNTMDPKKLEQINMLAMRLAKLNPTEGLSGASFSLKELMSGDYTSIAERFNINGSMLKDSQARKAGMQGDVDAFINEMSKLLDAQNMTSTAFEKMLDSPLAKWNRIVEIFKFKMASAGREVLSSIEPILNSLMTAFDSGTFDVFFNGLQAGLRVVSYLLSLAVDGAIGLIRTIQDGDPILIGVLAAIGTIILIQVIPALWAMATAAYAAIVPWLIMNWHIIAIAATIGILIGSAQNLGITFQVVVGFISGLFAGLYAYIMSNVALTWNTISSFAEFLINIFIDPVYAIQKLFYDLVTNFGSYMINMVRSTETFAGSFIKLMLGAVNGALKGLNWFIEKANDLLGTSFGTVDLINEDNIHAVSDSLQNMMNSIPVPTSNKGVVSIPRMHQKDIGAYAKKGYSVGYNTTDNVLKSIDGFLNGSKTPNTVSDQQYNLGGSNIIPDVDKVKEVGKIQDKVDISSEDLKLMRELAEMKTIQNFVSLEPTVQITAGDIREEADINKIVASIKTVLQEDIASSAAGTFK